MVAQKEDVPEGPYIQSMPSEGIRNQLISMARALHQSVVRIEPKEKKVRGVKVQYVSKVKYQTPTVITDRFFCCKMYFRYRRI